MQQLNERSQLLFRYLNKVLFRDILFIHLKRVRLIKTVAPELLDMEERGHKGA